jgi:sulfhydrogenase subunit beta (sulfur reductase)
MQVYMQTKEEFFSFILALQQEAEVIAPVKRATVRFEPIENPSEIHLDGQAILPLKEFFFKHDETLFLYVGKRMEPPSTPRQKDKVFFGIRRCDLAAIRKQDRVYLQDVPDPYYTSHRSGNILIGYHCEKPPSRYCFCGSLELGELFDLMYYTRGDLFMVEVGSKLGETIIGAHQQLFKPTDHEITAEERKIPGTDKLKHTDIKKYYDHSLWKVATDMCVACGQCTALCPTCYCFEIRDEANTEDLNSGKRIRTWSSCMVQDFTRVAGDHVFRKEHDQRFKHRIYHQLDYFKEKHGEHLCVGCGRCITYCPALIDFVHFINHMEPVATKK